MDDELKDRFAYWSFQAGIKKGHPGQRIGNNSYPRDHDLEFAELGPSHPEAHSPLNGCPNCGRLWQYHSLVRV